MISSPAASTILVPLDGSPLADQAIPAALALASADTSFEVLHVIAPEHWTNALADRFDTAASSDGDPAGTEIAASVALFGKDRRVKVTTVSGDPADQIVTAAGNPAIQFVVLASHARNAIGRWLHGSVAARVASASPAPVVVVREEANETAPKSFSRILVPLDGSTVARQALPVASALAQAHGWPIHLLTAINPATMTPIMSGIPSVPIAPSVIDEISKDLQDQASETLKTGQAELAKTGLQATTEVVEDDAVSAIESAARPGDLIVMTSHGRTGVQRWLLGSVADELVRHAPAPVMLVPAAERARLAAGSTDVPS